MSMCSVIMVSRRAGPMLLAAVKSVLRQQLLAELIIIDGGNPPDMLARLQQMTLTEHRLRIISGIGQVDFSRGCNLGAKESTGEYLLFLNPDCLLPPDALKNIMEAFSTVSGAILAGCSIVKPDATEVENTRQQLLTPETAISEAFGLHRMTKMKRLTETAPMPADTHQVEAISGLFMCMQKQNFDKLEGMDEAYTYGSHLDLCMRVRENGGKIICVPKVQVTHMEGDSAPRIATQVEWKKARGYMRYFRKHFGDDVVPGFLSIMNLAIVLRFAWRVVVGKTQRLFAPKLLMSHTVPAKRLMILASGLAELPEKKDWYGKTVLVTGATSQVGLCVLRRLIASGAAVLAISRGEAIPYQHEHLRWIKGDLTDAGLDLQGYLVDMVVHCAPLWTLPATIDLLADAEVKRIVAFGSTSIFGKALSHNAFEKDVVNKLLRAETLLAEHCERKNIPWTILRPTLIYGVGLDLGITSVAKFIDRFGFFPVYPPAFGRRQPVHADDLAVAVMQVAGTPVTFGKAYNISGGEVITYHQMLERLFQVCRKRTNIIKTTLLPFLFTVYGMIARKKHINGEIAHRMNDDLVFFHDDATRDFAFHSRPFLNSGLKDIEGF